MKKNVELMNLYWTSAGVIPSRGEISRFDFKDRVKATAEAGFKGIGIWHTDPGTYTPVQNTQGNEKDT